MSTIAIDTGSMRDYDLFLRIKSLPKYRVFGGFAEFPNEYAAQLGFAPAKVSESDYTPSEFLFDYQRAIAQTAITKRKYCVFADCGLGKTLILLEFARHVARTMPGRRVLIVSPLMVVKQTMDEQARFYKADVPLVRLRANELAEWLRTGSGAAITNYDAITDELPSGDLAGLVLDESSMLKSHYGAWGTRLVEMGKGVPYKLALTGTPAPNDRIEYANHAVFMDAFPNVNSFLARFFINRGQTAERWEIKAWALESFYIALSHWCIFLSNPATYGWKDGTKKLPPIHVHITDVALTREQRTAVHESTGDLFVTNSGGIGTRAKIARIGKGFHNGEVIDSNKTRTLVEMIQSWPDESTIVWCKYNAEQDAVAAAIPGCASIDGDTPESERQRIIEDFKAKRLRVIVTKPKILGFGLNLQVCTRQVFSTLQDSYEEFYQAVKRSNRYGSRKALNVHIPVTELEHPMVQTVLRKANRVHSDTEEQERIFHAHSRGS